MIGRRLAAPAAVLALLLAAAAASAQPPQPATQLQGTFQMAGTVTVAQFVRGEHVGETVQRNWTFTPLCSAGTCSTVRLVRARATGTDTLTLTAVGPRAYAGNGQFYAPLRCAGQVRRPGQEIPFRITVHVTATGPATGGATMATAITATYVNASRLNLTRCVAVLGHDAARYTGTLAPG
jgi:hypothetical protein